MNEIKRAEAKTNKCFVYLNKAYCYINEASQEVENIEPYLLIKYTINQALNQFNTINNKEV